MLRSRHPSSKTVSLLLQFDNNVDVLDAQRNTPLHLIAQRREDVDNILVLIDLLCDRFGAHVDCVNIHQQTPLECAANMHVKSRLREKISVGRLKCLCARVIRRGKVPFRNESFSSLLCTFIDKH